MTTHRREARAAARQLLLGASPEQIDMWRAPRESRQHCFDRLLRLINDLDVYVALHYMGAM